MIEDFVFDNCLKVLNNYYKTSYTPGDVYDYLQFVDEYESIFNQSLEISQNDLDEFIINNSCKINDKYCSFNFVISSENRKVLLDHLVTLKDSGVKQVSLKRIYDDYEDFFISGGINKNCLESIWLLISHFSSEYTYFDGFIYLTDDYSSPYCNEVVKVLIESDIPMSSLEIKDQIVSSSLSEVDNILSKPLDSDIIEIESDLYAHYSYFMIDDDFKSMLDSILKDVFRNTSSVSDRYSIRDVDLYDRFNNEAGTKDYLQYKYSISTPSCLYNITKLLKPDYYYNSKSVYLFKPVKSKGELMLDEFYKLDSFSTIEMNHIFEEYGYRQWVYLESILEKFVRVDSDNFISKDKINFDVKTVDKFVSRLVTNGYCTTSSITTYSSFPEMSGYRWNKFLFVSYIYGFSNDFKFVHYGELSKSFDGIIIDKKLYSNFDDVAAQYLIDSKYDPSLSTDGEDIAKCLKDGGFIQRISKNDFHEIRIKVRTIRSKMNV